MRGKVIRVIAGFYDILEENTKVEYRTRGSGNLRNLKQMPLVGDYVEFEPNGFLMKIYPRKNFFERPKIANVDQVIVVMSLKEPDFSSLLLDKFLMIIEFKKIHPVLFFTKRDLTENSVLEKYQIQGYECYEIINDDNFNFEQHKNIFKNKTSVFLGQTGTGKTSTINSLSKTNFATQTISKALGRGKHTTRVVQIIQWNDGELVDTPGFSNINLNLNKLEMSRSFNSFRQASKECKYKTCIHYLEQTSDCKVKLLVASGKILQERYNNYLHFLKEVI